jgi:hypothetical protein
MENQEQMQKEELQGTIERCKWRGRVALRISIIGLPLGSIITLASFYGGIGASIKEDYGDMMVAVVFLGIGCVILVGGLLALFTALIIRGRCVFLEKRSRNSGPESINT